MTNSTRIDQDVDTSRHAGGCGDTRPRSMNLELKINESFLRLIAFMRARLTDSGALGGGAARDTSFFGREEMKQLEVKKGRGKLTRLLARTLQLGERVIARTDEVDIVVKFLYSKLNKIVFQLRENEEFVRIDILWSNIQTMQACFDDNKFDTLRINVRSSSELYRAMRPPAGRHRLWRQQCEDYASRTFYLEFEKGTLERSYGKMLYTDPSLILSSLSPPKDDEEAAAQAINTQQVLTQQTRMSAPLASLPHFVQGATPSTTMMSSTNAGTNFTTHEYGGIQLYDSAQLAQIHSLYR